MISGGIRATVSLSANAQGAFAKGGGQSVDGHALAIQAVL
jgi:hypothetical protein